MERGKGGREGGRREVGGSREGGRREGGFWLLFLFLSLSPPPPLIATDATRARVVRKKYATPIASHARAVESHTRSSKSSTP
jgi:hypothetical protein